MTHFAQPQQLLDLLVCYKKKALRIRLTKYCHISFKIIFTTTTSIRGRPLCNFRFANDIDLVTGSEELEQLTERLAKTAPGSGMEISSVISKNSRQQHQAKTICQHMDEWKNARRSGPVQILRLHTNQRRSTIKEVQIRLAQAH